MEAGDIVFSLLYIEKQACLQNQFNVFHYSLQKAYDLCENKRSAFELLNFLACFVVSKLLMI